MKVLMSALIGILVICISGCGMKQTPIDTARDNEAQINQDEKDIDAEDDENAEEISDNVPTASEKNVKVEGVEWSSGYSLPVPKPDTEYIAPDDYGFFCYDMDEEKLAAYLSEIVEAGWSRTDEFVFEGRRNYTYVKDDMILQIVDHTSPDINSGKTMDEEDTADNNEASKNTAPSEAPVSDGNSLADKYILVNLGFGYEKIRQRENTLTKPEAAALIQEYINNLTDANPEYETVHGERVSMILEQFIEDSYEKMELQAFTVFNANGRLIGHYLISNKKLLYVRDPLEEVSIADIDNDGIYELLSLYGWGSGIYRIEISAYKYSNPIYFSSDTKVVHCVYHNCFVPKNGYGKLTFKKISDKDIHLLDHDWQAEENADYNGEPKDYGRVIVAKDCYHLVPEKLEQFPYDQWDYSYSQDILPSQTEVIDKGEIDTLKEPPEIHVTVGDKELDYDITKTDWDGKTKDSVSFSELMKDKKDLLLVDSPDFPPEFTDKVTLDFGDIIPDSIAVNDYLLMEDGSQIYSDKEIIKREVKIEGDGKFSFGLSQHFALMLSSSMATYQNPSYRGFRVICSFSNNKICEYSFVLMMGPAEK